MTLTTALLTRKIVTKLTGQSLQTTMMKLATARNVNTNIGTRTFSNATPHQHDVIHQNFQGTTTVTVDPIVTDYWKAHPNEHYSTYASSMSQQQQQQQEHQLPQHQAVVDYWNEHGETHFAEDKFRRGNNERRMNFSSSSATATTTTKPANATEVGGNNTTVKDYWVDHADTHFTDYWEETKGKTHF